MARSISIPDARLLRSHAYLVDLQHLDNPYQTTQVQSSAAAQLLLANRSIHHREILRYDLVLSGYHLLRSPAPPASLDAHI